MSDESLLSLSTMSSLIHLEINGSSKVNDSGVNSLVDTCKSLLFLNLNDCENITLDCIKFLVEAVKSDDSYQKLIICFNNLRINAKEQSYEQIEQLLRERDGDLDYVYGDTDLYELEPENDLNCE